MEFVIMCGGYYEQFGHPKAIYLPLSIDTHYVRKFKTKQTKDTCFVGRAEKKTDSIPDGIPCLEGLPRHELLEQLAQFHKAYAVDRCAIECKCLGVEVLPYGYGYGVEHTPDFWQILDSRDAAKILQKELDNIDG